MGEMDLDPEGEGEEGEGEDNWPHQWDMRQPFIEMLAGVVDERVMGDLDYLVDFLQWPKDPSEAEGERGEGLPPLAAFVALREALVRVKGQSLSPFPPSPLTRNNPGPFSNPLDIQGASSPGRRADSNAPSPGHRNSPFPLQPSPIAEVGHSYLASFIPCFQLTLYPHRFLMNSWTRSRPQS